ncbi:hypothetical protein J2799_000241 [Chryseobacterium vietnamense]|nr:hypothetical protein [Chryseobacterium vietnamense]
MADPWKDAAKRILVLSDGAVLESVHPSSALNKR